jgi:hypothetical protein
MQIYCVKYYAHDDTPETKHEYFKCPVLAARRLVWLEGAGYRPRIETVFINDEVEGK